MSENSMQHTQYRKYENSERIKSIALNFDICTIVHVLLVSYMLSTYVTAQWTWTLLKFHSFIVQMFFPHWFLRFAFQNDKRFYLWVKSTLKHIWSLTWTILCFSYPFSSSVFRYVSYRLAGFLLYFSIFLSPSTSEQIKSDIDFINIDGRHISPVHMQFGWWFLWRK